MLELDVLGLLRECPPLEEGIDRAEYISLEAAVDLALLPDDPTRSECDCAEWRTLPPPLETAAYCAYCELSTPPWVSGCGDRLERPHELDCVTRSTSELHALLCESTSMNGADCDGSGREVSLGVEEGTGNLTLLAELSALHAASSMTILSD